MAAPLIHVTVLDAAGGAHTLELRCGQSLMRGATDAGVEGIVAECGGTMTCATCHVVVDPAWAARLPPPGGDELAMLEMTATPAGPTSRLSCQIALEPALEGLLVRLPATQY
jgi:2Fe-2S ferredoxin